MTAAADTARLHKVKHAHDVRPGDVKMLFFFFFFLAGTGTNPYTTWDKNMQMHPAVCSAVCGVLCAVPEAQHSVSSPRSSTSTGRGCALDYRIAWCKVNLACNCCRKALGRYCCEHFGAEVVFSRCIGLRRKRPIAAHPDAFIYS